MSPWYHQLLHNTLIFPISKPNGEYQMVQDLRAINEAVVPLHLVVANPHTILAQIPGDTNGFTVLDLKDAFLIFCSPVHLPSLYLFAFEWTDPVAGCS